MPVEYNWAADGEDLVKLKRESRRGEWEAEGARRRRKGGRKKDGGRERDADVSGWISRNVFTLSDHRAKKSGRMSWPVRSDNMLVINFCLRVLRVFVIRRCSLPPFLPLSAFSPFIFKSNTVALTTVAMYSIWRLSHSPADS